MSILNALSRDFGVIFQVMAVPPPSLPISLARAYGVSPASTQRPAVDAAEPIARVGRTVRSVDDRASLSRAAELASERATPSSGELRHERLSRLVAATVPGGINFDDQRPSVRVQQAVKNAGETTIPMYRHPADRNAAATQVGLGKTVDLSG